MTDLSIFREFVDGVEYDFVATLEAMYKPVEKPKPERRRPPTWAELTMKNMTPANARFYGLKRCYLRRL